MKALVTGASGFIGSTLIQKLNESGFEVYAMMRKSSKTDNLNLLKYTRVEGDLSNPLQIEKALEGMDVIFHLAGVISAPDKEGYFQPNAIGSRYIAEACVKQKVKRVVYVSSMAAGGPSIGSEPRSERTPDQPVSFYGLSKKAGEDEFLKYKDSFHLSIIRPPIVFGPKDQATLLFFKTVAKRVIPLVGDKSHSYVYSEDLCDAILNAGILPSPLYSSGSVFYLGYPSAISMKHFFEEIAFAMDIKTITLKIPFGLLIFAANLLKIITRITGKSFVLNQDKLNEIKPDYWICDSSLAYQYLKIQTPIPFQKRVHQTVEWYKKHEWI